MELTLSQNICKLRKEHHLTQEQLAEALGVTFASVSKWERGAATPELQLIAKMADFFGVSLDALVGFTLQSGSIQETEEELHILQKQKKYREGLEKAEKALLRYPNNFRIVYRAGQLYALAGMEKKTDTYLYRGIGLLEQAITLLSQNEDPKISEASLWSEIAQSYLVLGKKKIGLEILKKYNIGGIHNALIALNYAIEENGFPAEAAEPYLMEAFLGINTTAFRTMIAYSNYYLRKKDYAHSREALLWLLQLLESVKENREAVAYVDKLAAVCYGVCALLSHQLGEENRVEPFLRRAFALAKAFDEAPTYLAENLKFSVGHTHEAAMYDDLGASALEVVENQLAQDEESPAVLAAWKKIAEEERSGGLQ